MAVRPYATVVLGAFCTAMCLEIFYIPHRLVDGGMTGLAVVIGRTIKLPPIYVLFLLDFACIAVGVKILGARFLYRSVAAFLMTVVVLFFVGPLHPLPLLPRTIAAVVGGAGVGFGVSLVVRAGGALDGCEVLALLGKTLVGCPIPRFVFCFNAFVFCIVALCFDLAEFYYSILAQGASLTVMALLLRNNQ